MAGPLVGHSSFGVSGMFLAGQTHCSCSSHVPCRRSVNSLEDRALLAKCTASVQGLLSRRQASSTDSFSAAMPLRIAICWSGEAVAAE